MSGATQIIADIEREHGDVDPAGILDIVRALTGTVASVDLADVHRAFGVRAYDRSAYRIAIEHYVDALETYQAMNDSYKICATLMNLGNAYGKTGEPDRMHDHFATCLETSRAHGHIDLEARTLMNMAVRKDNDGDPKSALAMYEELLGIARQIDDRTLEVSALQNIAAVLSDLGEKQRSLSFSYQWLDTATDIDDRIGIVLAKITMAMLYQDLSDLPTALTFAEEALELAESIEQPALATSAMCTLADIHNALGHDEQASDLITRAFADARSRDDLERMGFCERGLGQIAMKNNDVHASIQHYRASVDHLHAAGFASECLASKRLLVEALANAGLVEEAVAIRATYPPDQFLKSTDGILEEFVAAALAKANGDVDAAVAHYQRARSFAIEQGEREHELAVARELLDIAKERQDFAAFVEQTETIASLTDKIRGAEIRSRIALRETERMIKQERDERERERLILYATLPKDVADRMIRGEHVTGDNFASASVLFADIVGFTRHTAQMPIDEVPGFLGALYRTFDQICAEHGVTKVKTIGDSYLCFKGDAEAVANATAVAHVAWAMQHHEAHWPVSESPERLLLRIGLHCGPVTAGVIGTERLQYDIWGDTVNVASRMESSGEPGRIHISAAFAQALTDAPYSIVPRGEVEIKGKGAMTTYWLEGA